MLHDFFFFRLHESRTFAPRPIHRNALLLREKITRDVSVKCKMVSVARDGKKNGASCKTLKKFWQRPLIKSARIAGLLANCYDRLLYSLSIYKKNDKKIQRKKHRDVASGDLAAEMREAQRNKLTHYWPTYGTSRSHFRGVLPGSPGKRKLPATHSTCPLIPSAGTSRHIVIRTTKPWGVKALCNEDKRFWRAT